MPQFEGCEHISDNKESKTCANKKMLDFIYNELKYPEEAILENVEGTVVIRMIIDEKGFVKNAEINRNLGAGCGEEALRIVKSMGKWNPGMHDGKPVNVIFNLPITFKLPD